MTPQVSVMIPTYNRALLLQKAIQSVLDQTFQDFEILVINNYSKDNTTDVVKSFKDKRIRIINFRNEGIIARSRNRGLKESQGNYIAFLDSDDLWLPDKLEKQVKLLDSNKELGLVYSDNYVIDGIGNLKKKSLLPCAMFRGNVFNELFYRNFIGILTVIIRKEVLNKVGMFDPKYKIATDYDLFLRIAEYYPVDFVEEPLAKYRVHAESFSKNMEITVDEDLQIMNYWLNKKPELKRELRGKIRLKRARLCYNLTMGYLRKHEYKKAVKGIYKLCKGIVITQYPVGFE